MSKPEASARYCTYCGHPMVETEVRTSRYSQATGKAIVAVYLVCSNPKRNRLFFSGHHDGWQIATYEADA